MTVIDIQFHGVTLYLLDRLNGGITPERRRDSWRKAYEVLVDIFYRARRGIQLGYRSEALPLMLREEYEKASQADFSPESFDLTEEEDDSAYARHRELEEDQTRVTVFPISSNGAPAQLYVSEEEAYLRAPVEKTEGGIYIAKAPERKGAGWHQIVQDALQDIPAPPNPYKDPKNIFRLRMIGTAAETFDDLSRHFGLDTGDKLLDLMCTAVSIGNALRDLEKSGEFFFEDYNFPVPEPVEFFRKSA